MKYLIVYDDKKTFPVSHPATSLDDAKYYTRMRSGRIFETRFKNGVEQMKEFVN